MSETNIKARFHLPDFTRFGVLNLILATYIKDNPDFFREGVEVASVYGVFPVSSWNGGRSTGGKCDRGFIRETLKRFNKLGIPCRFTFTNPMLTEADLKDSFCNSCLKLADNGLNEVILVSPILEKYIRETYPSFKITSSTCKQLRDKDELYAELEKDYHLVVLDYNWNNRFDELAEIPHKEKCELLVNACCAPDCKRRGEHYRFLGEQQLEYCKSLQTGDKFVSKPFVCEHMNKTIHQIKEYSTHITPDDIWNKYIPMGFSEFKIEGRSSHLFNVVDTYIYYLAKPERADEARFHLLMSLAMNGVIKIQ